MKIWLVALIALLVLWIASFGSIGLDLVTVSGLYAMVTIGLSLLVGLAGQTSLGHAGFYGIGAYASAAISGIFHWTSWVGIAVGVFCACTSAIILGLVTFRLRGSYLAMTTLGWGVITSVAFRHLPDLGGLSGFRGIPPFDLFSLRLETPQVFCCFVWIIVLLLSGVTSQYMNSRCGRAVEAVGSRELAARSLGINATHVRLQIFALSAALAAIAGSLYAHYLGFVSPGSFGQDVSFKFLAMAVLGGLGSIEGAIVGALTIGLLERFIQDILSPILGLTGELELVFYGLILIFFVVRYPRGIASILGVNHARTPSFPMSSGSYQRKRPIRNAPLLEIERISRKFGGLLALDNVSFTVKSGEAIGLIGANGAGKSTLSSIISGALQPTEGIVRINGTVVTTRSPESIAAMSVRRTFQTPSLFSGLTVLENVLVGMHLRTSSGLLTCLFGLNHSEETKARFEAWQLLSLFGITSIAYLKPDQLPLGQRRLVEVARAISGEPELLLLDEPAAGLRPDERTDLSKVLQLLIDLGQTFILIEHNIDLVMAVASRVVVMDQGHVVALDRPEDIQEHVASVKA
jgi:ABC-type branched-subunit amino acid transport system ATPase component/ABC-type branched-subunit amino acid transport system permease subunit